MTDGAKPPSTPAVDKVAQYERWGKWAALVAGVGYVVLWALGAQERFALLGDAMGPLTGVLTALALFAAIEGVRLQRKELELQREELAESREVMREQARAAVRSAETQERLAKAQEALARYQRDANLLTFHARSVSLDEALVGLKARAAECVQHKHSAVVRPSLDALAKELENFKEQFKDDAGFVVQRELWQGSTQSTPPNS